MSVCLSIYIHGPMLPQSYIPIISLGPQNSRLKPACGICWLKIVLLVNLPASRPLPG